MSIHRNRLDLQYIKEPGLHERPKSLIEKIRAVRLSIQPRESFGHKAGMQSLKPADGNAVKVINRSSRDRDLQRYSTIDRLLRRASSHDLDVVVTARLEVCLQTPRNISYARVGVRSLQKIDNLSTQGLRIVNSPPGKRDAAKEILPAFVNRNDDVDLITFLLELVTRR